MQTMYLKLQKGENNMTVFIVGLVCFLSGVLYGRIVEKEEGEYSSRGEEDAD